MIMLHAVLADAQSSTFSRIDSARLTLSKEKNDSYYINSSFFIAESFMELSMYDSAQTWLNVIAGKIPLRKPSFFNFYLSVDQSETYYYNGLMNMHLVESERMVRIAEALKDSILLATAYNFLGLAYMNTNQAEQSKQYFLTGIRYARQPPYPAKYLSASKPHHLYGNLSEACFKTNQIDSARLCAWKSFSFASEIHWPRGIAVAENMLGLIYMSENKFDSAIQFHRHAVDRGLQNNQEDVSLAGVLGIAKCYVKMHRSDSAMHYINRGFRMIETMPAINSFYIGDYYKAVIEMATRLNMPALQIRAMQLKMQLDSVNNKKTDQQINIIVKGSVANETRASALELEESKSKQKLSNIRFLIALTALLSVLVIFYLTRRYHKRQLQELEIRQKISRDLHDDIGATLSSIQMYGELANQLIEERPQQSKEMLYKISGQSKDLGSRISDVIWSMKPASDDKNSLEGRLRNFSNELLLAKGIQCRFDIDEELEQSLRNPVARKNIMLMVKEAMNNVAKYSEATEMLVRLNRDTSAMHLFMEDNGKGFTGSSKPMGNGLENMRSRALQLKGDCSIMSEPGKGVKIHCRFPLTIISHI